MAKKLSFVLCMTLLVTSSYAVEIQIAPLAVYDNNGNKINAPSNPSKAIHEELAKHWFEGLITFSLLPESRYAVPVTIIDANKICVADGTDYLIYGYVKKNETSWFAEIKLFDALSKKIIEDFFASDGIEHYDRMLAVLARNILDGIESITGLQQDELKQEKTRDMELKLPASLYYWSPIDGRWGSKILGIAGVNAGLEFYPRQPVIVSNGKLIDLSTRFNLSWNMGVNKKDTYPLTIHNIAIGMPIFFHVHLDAIHSIYTGMGLAYEMEFMSITPKYENTKSLYQNIFIFQNIIGYEYVFNKKVNIYSEITFDHHIAGDGFISVKPTIGASFNIYKEQR